MAIQYIHTEHHNGIERNHVTDFSDNYWVYSKSIEEYNKLEDRNYSLEIRKGLCSQFGLYKSNLFKNNKDLTPFWGIFDGLKQDEKIKENL